MEQIICQNLAIGHDGKVLLQDINFSVKEGDYLCSRDHRHNKTQKHWFAQFEVDARSYLLYQPILAVVR